MIKLHLGAEILPDELSLTVIAAEDWCSHAKMFATSEKHVGTQKKKEGEWQKISPSPLLK